MRVLVSFVAHLNSLRRLEDEIIEPEPRLSSQSRARVDLELDIVGLRAYYGPMPILSYMASLAVPGICLITQGPGPSSPRLGSLHLLNRPMMLRCYLAAALTLDQRSTVLGRLPFRVFEEFQSNRFNLFFLKILFCGYFRWR